MNDAENWEDLQELIDNARSEACGDCYRTVRETYPKMTKEMSGTEAHRIIMDALDKVK